MVHLVDHFEFSVPVRLMIPTLGFTFVAAYTDFRSLKIPNSLTFLMLISSLLYHLLFPYDLGIPLSVAGMLTAFILTGPFFFMGGLGAGDVKLFLGIGAWIGPQSVLLVFFVTSVLISGCSVWKIILLDHPCDGDRMNTSPLLRFFPRKQAESMEELLEKSPQRLIPVGILIAIAQTLLIIWEVVRLHLQDLFNS